MDTQQLSECMQLNIAVFAPNTNEKEFKQIKTILFETIDESGFMYAIDEDWKRRLFHVSEFFIFNI
jgi:hypothetical protein